MKEELAKAYDPKAAESRIYELWEVGGYFKAIEGRGKSYAIHLPPPNVTGSLHMGHALNATLSDVLIRYYRMKGYNSVWFPGTDHAGIATQRVVEKQLQKEGTSRWQLGREKFIERVWKWKEEYGNKIISQLKKLGASADWSRLRFTMDPEYAEQVKKTFVHYYKKDLLYRGKRVVSWCSKCFTSLSDLEIEYKPNKTKLWHLRYRVVGENDFVVVATTRPETMLGDSAVAVNPKDKRYKKLIGKKVLLPIQNREIPIVADDAVDMTFGTGAVKVTPAHDMLDAEIGERHNLPKHQVINERGKMTEEAGKEFEGLKVLEAREKVIAKITELGLMGKIEDLDHNVAVCYRCGTTLEPLLSNQWFLKMKELADSTLKVTKSGEVKVKPKNFEKILYNWLENIRDWNISRQIWWGHQVPVWECACTEKKGSVYVDVEPPIGKCKECNQEYKQSEDVLDTWFSSALWPFAQLSKKDLETFYPSNVLITARDIINLWVARMVFSGIEFMQQPPFADVLIHATILTKEGRRMSKSLGTGIDPVELIEKYGADATRFGIIWQAMGNQDIHWDEAAVMAGKKFANKLWNIARFTQGKLGAADPFKGNRGKIEKYDDQEILKKFDILKKEVEKGIKNYTFGPALHKIYDFVWHEVADKYIESAKHRDDKDVKIVLGRLLSGSVKLLHPFMPFITEEIYERLATNPTNPLIVEKW